MMKNRTVGIVFLAVGAGWLATLLGFLVWMVYMESVAKASKSEPPNEAAWRLWRALEILLVEPAWLANLLAIQLFCWLIIGIVLCCAGVSTLRGNAQGLRWAAIATASGVILALIGFAFHWALLMPAVNASENAEVARASGDLNQSIPAVLGVGFGSMVVVGIILLGARRQGSTAGTSPPQG